MYYEEYASLLAKLEAAEQNNFQLKFVVDEIKEILETNTSAEEQNKAIKETIRGI